MQMKSRIVRDGQFYFLASLVREVNFAERVRLEPIPLGMEEIQACTRVVNFMEGTRGDIGPSIGRQGMAFVYGKNGEEHLGEIILEGMVR